LHSWPLEHAELVPHRHVPEGEQLSAVAELHGTHVFPFVPQLERDGVVHVDPAQHPFAHDIELHTHTPPEHTWPVPQMDPLPHRHAPAVEQLSAFAGSHAAQAWPPTPQVDSEDMSHIAPAQHPFGQLAIVHPVQTPAVHICGLGHI
jgi:hypothetical protein